MATAKAQSQTEIAPGRMRPPRRDRGLRLHLAPVEQLDLTGRKLVVVGGTDGLGRAIASTAVSRGARVTVVGRTFREAPSVRLSFVPADLSSMREAVGLGRELPVEDCDLLLLTTGTFAGKVREETAEGLERDMAVSFLSRLAVLRELAGRLGSARTEKSFRPRVFVMGSPGWGELGTITDLNTEGDYKAMKAHGNTLAGNEALALAGDSRFPGPSFFGLAPAVIKTDIRANLLGDGTGVHRVTETLIGLLAQSAQSYARRMVPLMFAPDLEGRSGDLFGRNGDPIRPSRGFDKDYALRFLTESEALLDRALSDGRPAPLQQ
ncbi:SDR family NAD(P)-dependent oxidoreductase [Streptomyces sp. NPDC058683]|uniref:SDR family NAD(P)-dependent oxidoreductase n=1 Tax=Streptomyces sp. NPDC058683 TaxID=3346597 RepID=UPI00366117A0